MLKMNCEQITYKHMIATHDIRENYLINLVNLMLFPRNFKQTCTILGC